MKPIEKLVSKYRVEVNCDKDNEILTELLRRQKTSNSNRCKTTTRFLLPKIAAVMLLLTAVGLFYTYQRPANTPVILQADNPDVTTYGSLLMAYRTGGMEKLDQLCDKALGLAGPWPADISMRELLEVNGNSN